MQFCQNFKNRKGKKAAGPETNLLNGYLMRPRDRVYSRGHSDRDTERDVICRRYSRRRSFIYFHSPRALLAAKYLFPLVI